MTKIRKILIVLCLFFVLLLLGLLGTGFYYYSNPSKLKPLVESTLSRFTGTECSIKEISYSRHPLVIRAKGIQFIEHIQGLCLEIPEIFASITLEGSFGGRSLVFKELRVPVFSLSINRWQAPQIAEDNEGPSLLRRILGGLFSFLLVKDVKVRDARVEEGHVTSQWGDLKVNLNGIHAHLVSEQILDMGCGVRVQSLSDQIDLKISRVKVMMDRAVYPPESGIEAWLTGEEIAFNTPQWKVTNASMEARILYSPENDTVDFESFKLLFEGVSLNEGGAARFVPLRSIVEANGSIGLRKTNLTVPSIHIVLGSAVEVKGELHAGLEEREEFGVKVSDLKVVPQSAAILLPNALKRKLDPFSFTGSILASGQLDGDMRQEYGQWQSAFQVRLRENRVIFTNTAVRFETRVAADIQAKGPLSSLEAQLTANCDDASLQVPNVRLNRGAVRVSLSGTYPAFEVKALKLDVPDAVLNVLGRELSLEKLEGQAASGKVDVEAKTLQLPELTLRTSTLKGLSISTKVAQGQLTLGAVGKDVHLADFLQAMRFVPANWKIASTDSLDVQTVLDGDGHLSVVSKMEIQGLSFESPEGKCMGENVSLVVEPTLEGTLKGHSTLNGSMFLYVKEGELLYDRFYLDLSKHNLIFNGKGRYQLDISFLELPDFRFELENLATLTAQGTLASEKSDKANLRLHFSKAALGPLFRQFVVEPFKHQSPFLEDLQLNGFVSADFEMGEQDTRWTLKGHMFWQEGEALLQGKEILLKGLDLDLPLWYQGGTKSPEDKSLPVKSPIDVSGGLSIQSAQFPLLPEQPIDLGLQAAPDRLSTTSTLSLKVNGGQVDLSRIVSQDLFSGSPELDTGITIGKIDLGPWLSSIWPKPVEGSVLGRLNPVQWKDDTVRTEGEIVASLFGGRMTISNIEIQKALSLAPVIKLDAVWEDLNLAEMTRDTAFGKIEGILRGHVKGLEIADGQPQKFNLFMETVNKNDVPQEISVRAVDNIAQIGGGASPFSGLTGAFVSFFKELPYEKIGIEASLENDVFKINGTVKENGREYLVKKGGFSGVDVIIGSSGSNTISFKDMVKRIKRVTASKGSPEVQ